LEQEYSFFENNYMIDVNGHKLATYGTHSTLGPRPEAYFEDVETAKVFQTEEEKRQFYAEMNAGAESGFDFSSRWFIKNGTNEGRLSDIKCSKIVTVELNAIIYSNAKTLAEFHMKLGNANIAAKYEQKAQNMFEAIQSVLWNDELGAWFDYDTMNQKQRTYFTPTNLIPLWLECYDTANKPSIARKVLAYINSTGIDAFPGGLPTTLRHSGEQWDYPNAWSPLQYIVHEGLRTLNDDDATELANKWTNRWTRSNFIAYNATHNMFEKYVVEELGGRGSGGEYEVQVGFGWTNGVIIEYLAKYGDILTLYD